MPLIMPEARYFSIPSAVVGGATRKKSARNCTPCVRSFTHRPLACTNSPAPIAAAWPTTVIKSRWPRAFTRRTQNPLSSLWKVTRSTRPARFSRSSAGCDITTRSSRSLFRVRRLLTLRTARSVSQSLVEQLPWHVQESKAPLVRRSRILGRLDGDLDRLVAEKYLDRDLHTLEIDLVPAAVRS